MTEPKATRCFGGPLSGRTMNVLHGREFVAPMPQRLPEAPMMDVAEIGGRSVVAYRYFKHFIGGREFAVWVPKEWTDDQAGEKVFAAIADLWAARLAE